MAKLAVVAYPVLPAADHAWIEAVRARHDPQASRLKAHFTLVFPLEAPIETLVGEVRAVLRGFAPIPIALGPSVARPDGLAEGGHVFLLARQGEQELRTLHERLYAGVLRPFLRTDVPFEPHVTIGGSRSVEQCRRIAGNLDPLDRTLSGTLQGAEVLDVSAWAARTVLEVPFGEKA